MKKIGNRKINKGKINISHKDTIWEGEKTEKREREIE